MWEKYLSQTICHLTWKQCLRLFSSYDGNDTYNWIKSTVTEEPGFIELFILKMCFLLWPLNYNEYYRVWNSTIFWHENASVLLSIKEQFNVFCWRSSSFLERDKVEPLHSDDSLWIHLKTDPGVRGRTFFCVW